MKEGHRAWWMWMMAACPMLLCVLCPRLSSGFAANHHHRQHFSAVQDAELHRRQQRLARAPSAVLT